RDDTPWYPTMRLFRQSKLGRWDDVFECMTEEVRKKLVRGGTAQAIPVTISPGELLDKLTILQIKSERVQDPAKLRNVRYELSALDASAATIPPSDELAALIAELKQVDVA